MTKKFLLTILCGMLSLMASAYDFVITNEDGSNLYFNFISHSDRTCEITKGNFSYSGEIAIPQVVYFDNLPYTVVAIGKEAFQNSQLTEISIPNSVTEIKTSAFSGCSLRHIDIPSSVTNIGTWAFQRSGLETIVLPNSITEFTGGGFSYFSDCPYLKSAVLPRNLKVIPSRIFEGCSVLSEVVLPDNLERIDTDAFADCPKLKSISLPESLKSISFRAFENSGLETIACFAETPPYLANDAFNNISKTLCHLKVPSNSIESYKNADHWNEFYFIEALSGGDSTDDICSMPTIDLVDGKLLVYSSTLGSTCHTTISSPDFRNINSQGDDAIELYGIYTIYSYASAPGYKNSDTTEATLVWYNPAISGGVDILHMEASKAILVLSKNNCVCVNGLSIGEIINIYNLEGQLVHHEVATDSTMAINCIPGIYVINIGNQSIKVCVR